MQAGCAAIRRAIAAVGLLAACRTPAPPRDVITVLTSNDILSVDPNRELENVTWSVLGNVYEPLIDFDAELRARPALAESWLQPSPDRWRFRLRRGAVFHDGAPVDAEAVKAALLKLRHAPEFEASQYLAPIESVEVVDSRTLDLVTRGPRALLSNLAIVLVTKPNASGAFPPLVGTGPYRLSAWEPGRRVVLERVASGTGPVAPIQRAVFEPEPDPAARLRRLAEGSADLTEDIPPALSADPPSGVRIERQAGLTLYVLSLNLRKRPGNPFADLRVRRALHLAIDRRALVDRLLNGQGLVATQPAPPRVFGFDPNLPEPRFDPQEARRLLAEAGRGAGFGVRLDIASDRRQAGELLREDLGAVGIDVEINAVPRATVYDLGRAGKSELLFMGWNFVSGESSEYLEYCLHTAGPVLGLTNYTGYSNRRLDEIAEENGGVLDPVKRRGLLHEAAAIAMADLPMLPLYVGDDIYAVRNELRFRARVGSSLRVADMELSQ